MSAEEKFCYYLLRRDFQRRSVLCRESSEEVKVSLDGNVYRLNVNEKDKRVLICFDGDIPSGGLPKGATVIHHEKKMCATRDLAKAYKRRSDFEDEVLYSADGDFAFQEVNRFFVLLSPCKAVFRTYKESLQPMYLIVDVERGSDYATFSTSSY